ncbi:type I methionyl aminopeptidase [Leptospira gomenensis]|uniref:Methionine aminopeptidase n=1 Tax=Leptospira gomenensis TaxID=2484974 RepID=A0A5F1YHG1_9LEPT|nr:type I methionyl aminopeptidase [Leptospira gomenensis]TGK38605.1 type I methionyl aminopeptidase [Leptospira gomenensis]TGK42842.1 type I methionyl aminopeptidase [Leptospira gomenensis]TGK49613.1 type I methionyl aminopeptidase [Leptospira gomenensis]TGK60717.1 type I methionyl aminopeptidase [Leptospira gomenensis]
MIFIKNKSEIEKMRAAGKLAAKLLDYISSYVKPGVSTLEINDLCEEFTRKHGAKSAPLGYKGFPKSVCTSVNQVVCHGIPKATEVLKEGDIINVDVTPLLDGYHGDSSRTFLVGAKTDPTVETLVRDTERAMYIGIEQIRPGNRVNDISNAIDDFLTPKGYGIVRDLMGHGIGRGFHEDPQVPHFRQNRKLAKLEPGMIFTVEPMVNLGTWQVNFSKEDHWTVTTKDGKWSAQFEHTVLVTEKGYEILTISD